MVCNDVNGFHRLGIREIFIKADAQAVSYLLTELSDISNIFNIHHSCNLSIAGKNFLIYLNICDFLKLVDYRSETCIICSRSSLRNPCDSFKSVSSIHNLDRNFLSFTVFQGFILHEYKGCKFYTTYAYFIARTFISSTAPP